MVRESGTGMVPKIELGNMEKGGGVHSCGGKWSLDGYGRFKVDPAKLSYGRNDAGVLGIEERPARPMSQPLLKSFFFARDVTAVERLHVI